MRTTQFLTRSSRTLLRRTPAYTTSRPQSSLSPSPSPSPSSCLLPKVTSYNLTSTSSPVTITQTPSRLYSSTTPGRKGLQPDTSDPEPPQTESHAEATGSAHLEPAELQESEYHEISEQYMNTLQLVAEEKAENVDEGFEVEYSAGVLTIVTPKGTYVVNKQPPNKQIWLSSPTSGPKRYDWVVGSAGEGGQHLKEGTETHLGDDGQPGGGKWIYLRDGSTLTSLLKKELDIDVAPDNESDVSLGREGPAGSG